jgi:hypothetical protein
MGRWEEGQRWCALRVSHGLHREHHPVQPRADGPHFLPPSGAGRAPTVVALSAATPGRDTASPSYTLHHQESSPVPDHQRHPRRPKRPRQLGSMQEPGVRGDTSPDATLPSLASSPKLRRLLLPLAQHHHLQTAGLPAAQRRLTPPMSSGYLARVMVSGNHGGFGAIGGTTGAFSALFCTTPKPNNSHCSNHRRTGDCQPLRD